MVQESAKQPGWKTSVDVIVAPKAAFERIAQAPKWVWAFLIAAVLGMAGNLIIGPALDHYMQGPGYAAELSRNPQFANMSSDQRDAALKTAMGFGRTIVKFSFIFVPIGLAIIAVIQSLVLLMVGAITKGHATFAKSWAVSMHAAVIGTGLYGIVNAVIVLLRGADSFTSSLQFQAAVPNLGLLVPESAVKLHAFFSIFNVFTIWSAAVLATGAVITLGIKRVPAIVTSAVLLAIGGLFATFSAN